MVPFAPAVCCSSSPQEWLPFGGGIRRCIGMAFALYEMKMVLATVLSRVDLRAAPGRPVVPVRRAITLAPSRGMPVVVSSRWPRDYGMSTRSSSTCDVVGTSE